MPNCRFIAVIFPALIRSGLQPEYDLSIEESRIFDIDLYLDATTSTSTGIVDSSLTVQTSTAAPSSTATVDEDVLLLYSHEEEVLIFESSEVLQFTSIDATLPSSTDSSVEASLFGALKSTSVTSLSEGGHTAESSSTTEFEPSTMFELTTAYDSSEQLTLTTDPVVTSDAKTFFDFISSTSTLPGLASTDITQSAFAGMQLETSFLTSSATASLATALLSEEDKASTQALTSLDTMSTLGAPDSAGTTTEVTWLPEEGTTSLKVLHEATTSEPDGSGMDPSSTSGGLDLGSTILGATEAEVAGSSFTSTVWPFASPQAQSSEPVEDSSTLRIDWSDASTSTAEWSEQTALEEEESEEAPAVPLEFIPQKMARDKTPLEALVEESDLQILGGNIQASDKYEVMRKIGMTLFAPVDSAFDSLPLDIKGFSAPIMLKRSTSKDANRGVKAMRHLVRKPLFEQRLRMLGSVEVFPQRLDVRDCRDNECGKIQMLSDKIGSAKYQNWHDNRPEKSILDDFEKLIMYHVVKRIVPPGMIEARQKLELKTELKGHNLKLELRNQELWVDGVARVTEIVHCRNGFLYKISSPLFPAFVAKDGDEEHQTLVDFVNTKPNYSKLRYLMKSLPDFSDWAKAGPITLLLIPDEAWKIEGIPVPPCFFRGLARPENADVLLLLLKWITIPGLWSRSDIQNSDWLPNGASPSLAVTNIRMQEWLRENSARLQRAEDEDGNFIPRGYIHFLDRLRTNNATKQVESPEEDTITLIEGKEVVVWDIPFYNGYGHVLSELPLRPDFDLSFILWDCLDFLCNECPIVTKYALRYLDGGGLLPDLSNPKAYIVPPGVRPQWVCQSQSAWYPPGWDYKEWEAYLSAAKTGNVKQARQQAFQGWRKAGINTGQLLDKLEEASVHLRRIWDRYEDPALIALRRRKDPNLLIGWLKNRRSLEMMPKICDRRGPRRPSYFLDHLDTDEALSDSLLSRREAYNQMLETERKKKFGMQDMKYISQWIK